VFRQVPESAKKILFILVVLIIIASRCSAAIALLSGVVFAIALGNPYLFRTRPLAQKLLQISIVGLGAGMDLIVVGRTGLSGIGYTAIMIVITMTLGYLFGKLLKTSRDTSLLISVGTAICGGSAIAAVAAAIKAKSEEVSVSLAIVFILNAVALFIFPGLGHALGFTQVQFGFWSALAVHDTSSVVGTAMQYGPEALVTGTTVKLARALWIVPVTIFISSTYKSSSGEKRGPVKVPWFILGFILMAAFFTWVPGVGATGQNIAAMSRELLVLTLFFIGSNLSRDTIKKVGVKPFLQGVLLWVCVSVSTAFAIKMGLLKI
jgi:uncharacterized integral membrane protein (TIGR00698 family)